VHPRQREIGIARRFCSSEAGDREKAVTAFVRLFTFSAPTDLALFAARCPNVVASYHGSLPLIQHLLESLPIPPESALAWRIALLEGSELSSALQTFHRLYADRIRPLLARYCRDPDDVYQHFLLRVMTKRRFRRTLFGKYAGEGGLVSYLKTAVVREAARRSMSEKGFGHAMDTFEGTQQDTEKAPDWRTMRNELRTTLTAAFRELAEDPGLTPFLLQQGFEMAASDLAEILGLNENLVRQRIFRFRRRFRCLWHRLGTRSAYPFSSDAPGD